VARKVLKHTKLYKGRGKTKRFIFLGHV